MASQFQLVIIEGYIAADPEMRFTGQGTAVTNFTIGSNREFKVNDEKKKETTWVRVDVWGKLAENVAALCKKGTLVQVVGRLKPDDNGGPRVFQRKDGNWGASYEVTAREVRIYNPNFEDFESRSSEGSSPAWDSNATEIPF